MIFLLYLSISIGIDPRPYPLLSSLLLPTSSFPSHSPSPAPRLISPSSPTRFGRHPAPPLLPAPIWPLPFPPPPSVHHLLSSSPSSRAKALLLFVSLVLLELLLSPMPPKLLLSQWRDLGAPPAVSPRCRPSTSPGGEIMKFLPVRWALGSAQAHPPTVRSRCSSPSGEIPTPPMLPALLRQRLPAAISSSPSCKIPEPPTTSSSPDPQPCRAHEHGAHNFGEPSELNWLA
jgi:hypothetical protein